MKQYTKKDLKKMGFPENISRAQIGYRCNTCDAYGMSEKSAKIHNCKKYLNKFKNRGNIIESPCNGNAAFANRKYYN